MAMIYQLIALLLLSPVNLYVVEGGSENTKVTRKIDISSHLIKITTEIDVTPSENPYDVEIEKGYENNLAFMSAQFKNSPKNKQLKIQPVTNKKGAYQLDVSGQLGKPVTILLTQVFYAMLEPFPAEVGQADKQFIRFRGSLYFYSPYVTRSQSLVISLGTTNVITYTKDPSDTFKPVQQDGARIRYGPYNTAPVQPRSHQPISVHYENNSPFLRVTRLDRLVELSHWGNVAVEERIRMEHFGAKLRGGLFSRYDYQRNQDSVHAVRQFTTLLPAAAHHVYYRDQIGNISTSHLKEMSDSVEVELRPRFPLFGGWKTEYTLGYNMPAYEWLFSRGSEYALRMRFIDHIFNDQAVDEAEVRVVLPERVSDIRVRLPYQAPNTLEELPRERLQTYLDTVGRTVLVFRAQKLVEHHIKPVMEIRYRFNPVLLLVEPAMLVAAFLAVFLVVIAWMRVDFSITRDEQVESRLRLAGLLDELQTLHDKRTALYQHYEDSTMRFKASHKDVDKFGAERRGIETNHKALSTQIAALRERIGGDQVSALERIKELQSLDEQYRALVSQSANLAEKLIQQKLNKQVYVESEEKLANRRKDLLNKMEAIVAH